MTLPDRRNPERGIALLAVVAVLVLLAIIATPFLVTMKDGAERGKALLASSSAALEAENVFRVATLHLGGTHDSLERHARSQSWKSQPSTPDWDTLEELQIPSSVLASAAGDPDSGRIWGVTVEDEAGKINVNTAPFTVLGHFFGMSALAAPLEQDATEAELTSPGGLPPKDGVVRIGDEVVRYDRLEGSSLRGLQRGFQADPERGNGPARKHAAATIVVNEVAFQIGAYPILARRGKVDGKPATWYAPFTNIYEVRRISDLGVAALPAEEWERVADFLTVSSRGITGHEFGDPQTLRQPVKAGEDGHKAVLTVDNPYRFGIGTTVRVTDGTHTDYAVVYGVGGRANIHVVPALQHDYDAGIARVEALIRTPVNINTAPREVLEALHNGLARHGQAAVGREQARLIAARILRERASEERPGIRGLRQYKDLIRKLADEGALQPEEATACELNALNPMDTAPGRLAVGTVPVSFRSCDVFTVTARAVVLDASGREIGRREFRRVVDVAPQGPGVVELAGQAALDENLRVVNAKHFTTFPVNVTRDETGIFPPSRFLALFRQDRWPSADRLDPFASVRLAPSRLVYGPEVPAAEHYDNTDYAEGYYMESSEAPPLGTSQGRVAIKGDNGLEPFAASLWFKPYWGGRRTAYVLDSGSEDHENRFSLYYDGRTREMVFVVKDASLQSIASEVRYPFDQSSWEDDRWYHLTVSASGSAPGQATMLIDGVRRGKPTLLTHLTQGVDPTGSLTTLSVEDASSFPDSGALLLSGSDGLEVVEYTSRSSNSFQVRRRFARMNRADTTDDAQRTTTRAFVTGDAVTLYGYSIPTTSVVPEGSGTLPAELGRLNALVLDGQNPPDVWPNPQTAGGPTTGGGGGGSMPQLATGWRGDVITLNLGSDVHGWDGTDGPTAARAFGQKGYALLASASERGGALTLGFDPSGEHLFDAELVAYEVSGGNIVLTRRPEPTEFLRYNGASAAGTAGARPWTLDKRNANTALPFIPRHNYGDAADPLSAFLQQANINGGRIYADSRITEPGIISLLVPLSVEVAGADEETFLDPAADPTRRPSRSYVQIGVDGGTEWVAFDDAVRENSVSPNLLLVRDRVASRVAALFRTWSQDQYVADNPSDPPSDPPADPPPGGEPPVPPPPPEDDGPGGGPDAPPLPPDPGPGEDDGPGGTPDTPPVPPDPGPGEDDGPGGAPDTPPLPPPDSGGEDDGPGGAPDTPPVPPADPGGGEDDGPGGTPDTPPDEPPPGEEPAPPPPDGGGTTDPDPTAPPDPTTGPGGGPTTGTGNVTVPFTFHEIAKYLDMRPSASNNDPVTPGSANRPVHVADLPLRVTHAAGTQVLPCFLVAFPGIEYDPQANGSVVEEDLDAILTTPIGATASGGASPTTGGAGGGASPAGSIPSTSAGTASSTQSGTVGDTGDGVEPGSGSVDGRFVEPGPGEDDVVTLLEPGEDGAKEQHVVNWSFRSRDWNRARTVQRSWTWVAFKAPANRTFARNSRSFDATDVENYLRGRFDRRTFVRLLKSPSGELPVKVADNVRIGTDYNGGSFASAVVDEVRFVSPRSARTLVTRSTWFAGAAPALAARGTAVNPEDLNIPLHAARGFATQTYATGLRPTGGIVRIGDELIGYATFDEGSQTLMNCERGAFGTEARRHAFGEPISPVFGVGVSRLEEGLGQTSSDIPLASASGFPLWGGFVRIGDEVIGYTRVEGSVLKMPEGITRRDDGWGRPVATDAGSNRGEGLLRGRFGTQARAHDAQSLVYHLDHRFPDLARDRSDHPQLAWYTVSREVKGAIWKRVSWDERLRNLNGIRVLVRFDGGPAWDSDRLVRIGSDPIPGEDRARWIYEVTNPRDLNLLNVQSDRIECRVFFTYEAGAYNLTASPAPDAWKETPWLQAFRIEYAAPTGVLVTEDIR